MLTLIAVGLIAAEAPPATWPIRGSETTSRAALVRRLILKDSAVELVFRPCRTTWRILTDPAYQIYWHTRGTVGKALLPWHAHCQPLREDRPSLDAAALEADLAAATKVPLEPAHIQLFPEGSAALAVLEHLIDTASGRIDVLMYLWDSDDLGRAVAEHLACWARKGRPVRVLVDGGGNLLHGDPRNTTCSQVNRVVNWLAHQPNVQVLRTRNPLARFDHRKLVLVDGRIAWTGGRNFCRAAFEEEHDLTVTVEGPLVDRMCATFEKFWREQGGKPLPCLCWCPPAPPVDPYVNAEARLVSTAPGQRDLLKTICIAVNHACHHIYLENPYLADGRLICHLAAARRRGVDVRVVLTLDSKVELFDRANRLTVNRLLAVGIRVYRYPGRTHMKAISIDGCWAYLGTGNFDALSLHRNRELGLAIGSGPVLEEIDERVFRCDFRPDWEMTAPVHVCPRDRLSELLVSFCL